MRKLLTGLALAASVTAMAAGAPRAEEPTKGGTLIATLGQTPRHLNPAVQSGVVTGAPGAQLFAAPLRYDED